MKKLFLISAIIFLFATQGYSSVTTIDGAITLDFYEDTQFGNNRWIFDIKLNDIGGGVESIYFDIEIQNTGMTYGNDYNFNENPIPLSIGINTYSNYPADVYAVPHINSLWLKPINSDFTLYAIPSDYRSIPLTPPYGDPIIDNFNIVLSYSNNLGQNKNEILTLSGPTGFATVPEPTCISLFVFGTFLLRWLIKKK